MNRRLFAFGDGERGIGMSLFPERKGDFLEFLPIFHGPFGYGPEFSGMVAGAGFDAMDDLDPPSPEDEIAGFLGPERISLEMGDHDTDEIGGASGTPLDEGMMLPGAARIVTNCSDTKECMDLIDDVEIIESESDAEAAERMFVDFPLGFPPSISGPAQEETAFSIDESAQPMSEGVTIGRMVNSHGEHLPPRCESGQSRPRGSNSRVRLVSLYQT